MWQLQGRGTAHTCDGLSRRDFLQVGSLGAGLGLSDFAALQAAGAVDPKSDKNGIMIFNLGAPSQLDCWDLKPQAPLEIRGPFQPIDTRAPGIQISEMFPGMARHGDKISYVRTVYHTAAAVHDTGHQMMQTGRLFSGGLETPHVGCVLGFLKGRRGDLPPHVVLPEKMGATGGNLPHGQEAGFLGKPHDPFVLNADPSAGDFRVPDLLPPAELPVVRTDRRRKLRELVDQSVREFEGSPQAKLMDANFEQAYRLMTSSQAREAFALEQESDALRDRYGRNRFGQCLLLARRLIERGVRFVTVNTFLTVFNEITWDIHGSVPFTSIEGMKKTVAPVFDQGVSALLEDLQERGLLENTVIPVLGEFGRTPKVNPAGGRDHWPQVWTVWFAGGGIAGGRVVGQSDETGGYPVDRPTTTSEVVATIYRALGIDLEHLLPGPQQRPVPVVDSGVREIRELF
ncbi:MAG TPA: DUF1501 domain-containing protein [Planctomycetaceae bacterium]|jgi:hypothetical protein|nr:DUF1501 domain-containing protein [Planctomycetaceae bacterium]